MFPTCPGRTALMVFAVLALTSPARAADEKDAFDRAGWEPVLRQQVKTARSCDMKDIISANVIEIGKQKILEGRLNCFDGREFTFTRKHEHQKFDSSCAHPRSVDDRRGGGSGPSLLMDEAS